MMIDQKHRNLLDVEAWLRRELEAAFDFLSLEKHQHLWLHCSRELADRVQARARRPPARGTIPPPFSEDPAILAIRDQFFRELEATAPGANFTGTEALSWAIIVEAALLNKRLLEDIEDIAAVKCCRNLPTGETWIDFYSPHPSPEAREIFKQYVTCRWPIHVFALDPVVDEQNIADQFSRRRELQLALAVGVAQGAVNASTAMQFMRRVETDLETISLNRTMVGFAHGPDTFGWRFYPRVQPPPTVGNGRAFLQTLTGRPTSGQDIQTRQLEPGMRECEAVVIMPSFVPYVTFDIRTNWFCLTHPGKVELTLHDTMKLSRIYEGVRQQAGCVQGQCKYRAGDVCHLTRVIQQLERQLPLQTMLVHVPYENTLGGFEMFATGVTDLGPEFKGFYGEPGVRVVNAASAQSGSATAPTSAAAAPMNAPANSVCGAVDLGMNVSGTTYQCQGTCGGTTLFLVGKNFSVHETKVVAGGRCVPFVLLSREIMRVTIPNDVDTVTDATKEEWVDVHLATPYGVTSHLAIPAIRPAAPAAASKAALGWDTTSFQCQICYWPLAAGGRPVAAGGQQLGVQALAYQKAPQKITATDSSDPVLRPRTACLQFRVSAQTGGTTPLLLGDTRPVPVVFDQQGKLSVDFQSAGGTGPGDLIKEVVMNRLDASQGATQIVADTYVNYDQPHSQGLPVVKFGKPLTIDIAVITCSTTNAVNLRQRPTPAGAGDRVPAEQPEEIPCENCPLPDLLPPGSTWGPPGPLPPPPPAPTTQSRSFRDMRPGRLAPRVVRLPPTD
ncbi:MAG TPA: hypothetical protein VJ783_25000 [Pirellulales bacterium]|nr:hypothetical protein [Pirellulales bacterium]